MPDTPVEPAFALRYTSLPLVLAVPSPVSILTKPPVDAVLRPASTLTEPPAPLVPLPTVTLTEPPVPPVAAPDPIRSVPVSPELEVPELNTSMPVAPVLPAFALRMIRSPLDDPVPSPLVTATEPPVHGALRPAAPRRAPRPSDCTAAAGAVGCSAARAASAPASARLRPMHGCSAVRRAPARTRATAPPCRPEMRRLRFLLVFCGSLR